MVISADVQSPHCVLLLQEVRVLGGRDRRRLIDHSFLDFRSPSDLMLATGFDHSIHFRDSADFRDPLDFRDPTGLNPGNFGNSTPISRIRGTCYSTVGRSLLSLGYLMLFLNGLDLLHSVVGWFLSVAARGVNIFAADWFSVDDLFGSLPTAGP